MSHDLYERLRRLKEEAERSGPPPARSTFPSDPARPATGRRGAPSPDSGLPNPPGRELQGWEERAPLVFSRRSTVPLPLPRSNLDSLLSESSLLASVGRGVGDAPPRIGFFDLETTGLSGGAGSYIFLFGIGAVDGEQFVVEQILLGDYPAEPDFIALVQSRLQRFDLLVSFNGKAFDGHLLTTRFLMNGIQETLPPQLDLLYPARSLYRSRIGSCSLSDIEREVLGVERTLDVAGFLIPGIYFDFLRGADGATLEPVAAHHLEDIVSLLKLFVRLETDLTEDGEGERDLYQAARLLLRWGRADRARRMLERAVRQDDNSARPIAPALLLSRLHLRAGEVTACEALWRERYAGGSVIAGIELAKLLEHRLRDYAAALETVTRLLAYPAPRIGRYREALEHRRARLERRIARRGAAGRK
ncbi:ribonuclease H-like domain-containing protein [Salinispira pacifica]